MAILACKVEPQITDIGSGQHLLVLVPQDYDPKSQTADFAETVEHYRIQLKHRDVEIVHEPVEPTRINIVGDKRVLQTLRMIYHEPVFVPAVRKPVEQTG